jgi:hypothetical protein
MSSEIRVTPLGAGQDVGRSCILVSLGGKNVMLDCGMHMGFQDERRFPDFTYIASVSGDLGVESDATGLRTGRLPAPRPVGRNGGGCLTERLQPLPVNPH